MEAQGEEWVDEGVDGQRYEWTNIRTDGQRSGWTKVWMDGQAVDGLMAGWMNELGRRMLDEQRVTG